MIPKKLFNQFGCRASQHWKNYKRLNYDNEKFKKTLKLEDVAVFNYILNNYEKL